MAEYIERDAVMDVFMRFGIGWGIAKVKGVINSIPAADVRPVVRGKWEWDGGEDMHYYCSCCHYNAYGCTCEILDGKYNFCPNCGAKMEGE